MKRSKQRITATVSMILIALALIGINADHAIAQGKARKEAKVRTGSSARIATATENSNFVATLDMDTRNAKTKLGIASKNEVAIETIEHGRRVHARR